jgi:hypothetical protein
LLFDFRWQIDPFLLLIRMFIAVENGTTLRLKSVPLYGRLTRHFVLNQRDTTNVGSGNESSDYITIS